MIVFDTHIWVWWVHGDERLTNNQIEVIEANENDTLGISSISCWEIAKLTEHKRLDLPCSLNKWFQQALTYPGIRLLEVSPEIAVESIQLPGEFQNDPADQIIVATDRIYNCPLLTSDGKILKYSHVETIV